MDSPNGFMGLVLIAAFRSISVKHLARYRGEAACRWIRKVDTRLGQMSTGGSKRCRAPVQGVRGYFFAPRESAGYGTASPSRGDQRNWFSNGWISAIQPPSHQLNAVLQNGGRSAKRAKLVDLKERFGIAPTKTRSTTGP